MTIVFFLAVMAILGHGVIRRPGMVIAYILLFQGFNSLLFELVGLSALRYGTTILLYPLVVGLHYGTGRLGAFTTIGRRSGAFQGYCLISVYMLIGALAAGSSHEVGFFKSFIFPGTVLFLIAGAMVYRERALRDHFIGILLFSGLTFFAVLNFNIDTVEAFYASRAEAGAETGMSVITQGRLAGLWALAAVLSAVGETGMRKSVGLALLVPAVYWLFLAGSRGPAVALVVTVLFYLLLSGRKASEFLYAVIIVGVVGLAFYQLELRDSPLATRTITTLSDPALLQASQRYSRWVLFFDLLPDHFLFGLGPGGWGKFAWTALDTYPHSILIEFVLDYGVVGAISLILIVGSGIRTCFRTIRDRATTAYQRVVVLAWLYYLLCTLVSGGMIHGNQPFFALTGLMVGMDLLTRWGALKEPVRPALGPMPTAAAVAGSSLG